MSIRFDDKVALITGAGAGLGRAHALALGRLGAKVVVNDLSLAPAESVAAEIAAAGGRALALAADVSNPDQVFAMVDQVVAKWSTVHILVNNAGLLRDKTFAKMDLSDFRKVVDVHLLGSAYCTKAVWELMRAQNYGRIVMTTSGSGIYGNFGQANYGAAKAGVVGLMNVLAMEGKKSDIRVNSLAPTAATDMTAGLLPQTMLDLLVPDTVSPGLLYLVSDNAPTQTILGAGGGCFAVARMVEGPGVFLSGAALTVDGVAEHFEGISDLTKGQALGSAADQTGKYVNMAQGAPIASGN
jgi:NAD(P)-dependent dehydrogenase (short-subunit alcohol dehydrogenase family)